MSGFRVGFAVGNKDMIQAKKYQTHTNRYVWCPSRCRTYALNHYDDFLDQQMKHSNVVVTRLRNN